MKYYAGPGGNEGELMAWDPIQREEGLDDPGQVPDMERHGSNGGRPCLLWNAWMAGSRRWTHGMGKILWQFKTGSGIIGQPITYRGPDGKQYVAILSGIGGWPGSIVSGNLDTRDDSAANGWGSALHDLKSVTQPGELCMSSPFRRSSPAVPRFPVALELRVGCGSLNDGLCGCPCAKQTGASDLRGSRQSAVL